jgi:hypothetical protein
MSKKMWFSEKVVATEPKWDGCG